MDYMLLIKSDKTVRQIQESSSRLLVTHADNTQTTSNDIISMHQAVRPSMMQIDT
jgi:hypothetical protein